MYLQVEGVNIEEMRAALREAPDVAYKFVRTEMQRIGNRFKKKMKKEHLSGRPGLDWPKGMAVPISAKVSGSDLLALKLVSKAARVLSTQEVTHTITPPFIKISDPKFDESRLTAEAFSLKAYRGKTGRQFFVLRLGRAVTIPARLHFRDTFNAMLPENLAKLEGELVRAVRVSFEHRLKVVGRFLVAAA